MATKKLTYEEMVKEAEQFKDTDQEFEGLTPVKGRVGKEARAVFAVRLSQAEMEAITAAAGKQARPIGDFIRAAALAAAAGTLNMDEGQQVAALANIRDRIRELDALASSMSAGAKD